MNISLDWISDYVDIGGIDPETIAERVTLHCAEVEELRRATVQTGESSDTVLVLEIDNKSLTHRPDLWGHYGFAREIAAIFGRPIRKLQTIDLDNYKSLPEFPVKNDDPASCPIYHCMEFSDISIQPSPEWIQRRLHSVGQRPINSIIDLTNYVMLETGQPTHAFDANGLLEIRVGPMGAEAHFCTLDGKSRNLAPEDLMIWSGASPIAIAGIMGGASSEVSGTTRRVILESANFEGSRVRRTTARIGLRTDASQRFEKNQPSAIAETAVARFAYLLSKCGEPVRAASRLSTATGNPRMEAEIRADFREISSKIGEPIPKEKIIAILSKLGFDARFERDSLITHTPPHRSVSDISLPEDVIEEIARIYGYDRIEPALPRIPMEPEVENLRLRREHLIQKLLSATFFEVKNYSWFDSDWLSTIGFKPAKSLQLENPSTSSNKIMRTNVVVNLLRVAQENSARRDRFSLFEIGRAFRGTERSRHREVTHVAAVDICPRDEIGPAEHFFRVKRTLIDILLRCDVANCTFGQLARAAAPWESPGRSAIMTVGLEDIGRCGILPDQLTTVIGGKIQIAWFELNLDALPAIRPAEGSHRTISQFPPSRQDFSILWPAGRTYAALATILDDFQHPKTLHREFLNRYSGKGLPDEMESYTFRYHIGSETGTLTRSEIDDFIDNFINFLGLHDLSLKQ